MSEDNVTACPVSVNPDVRSGSPIRMVLGTPRYNRPAHVWLGFFMHPEACKLGHEAAYDYLMLLAYQSEWGMDKAPRSFCRNTIRDLLDAGWVEEVDDAFVRAIEIDWHEPLARAFRPQATSSRGPTGRSSIRPSVRFRVLRRDRYRCVYCGASGEGVVLHVDHQVPVASGGSNEESNLVTSCWECNIGKGAEEA